MRIQLCRPRLPVRKCSFGSPRATAVPVQGNFSEPLGSLQNVDGSMMTAEQAAQATGLSYIPSYVGINMQLTTGSQTLMGIASGLNPGALSGSVGGADQIYTSSAASAAGDAAFAGSTENASGSIPWASFEAQAGEVLASFGLHDPRKSGKP